MLALKQIIARPQIMKDCLADTGMDNKSMLKCRNMFALGAVLVLAGISQIVNLSAARSWTVVPGGMNGTLLKEGYSVMVDQRCKRFSCVHRAWNAWQWEVLRGGEQLHQTDDFQGIRFIFVRLQI